DGDLRRLFGHTDLDPYSVVSKRFNVRRWFVPIVSPRLCHDGNADGIAVSTRQSYAKRGLLVDVGLLVQEDDDAHVLLLCALRSLLHSHFFDAPVRQTWSIKPVLEKVIPTLTGVVF